MKQFPRNRPASNRTITNIEILVRKVKTPSFTSISLHGSFEMLEVKILCVPKIAISNEDDVTLRIPETRLRLISTTSNSSSPFKSIIKTRSSQPHSTSSSTTQSFHTCHSRLDPSGAKKKEVDFTEHLSETFSEENLFANQLSPRKNRSYTTVPPDTHDDHSLRRTRSYYAASRRPSITEQSIQGETSSIYETPKHDSVNRYSENSIRLVIDTDSGLSANDQSDMQVNLGNKHTKSNPSQMGVSRFKSHSHRSLQIFEACCIRLCGEPFYRWLGQRDEYSLYLFAPNHW